MAGSTYPFALHLVGPFNEVFVDYGVLFTETRAQWLPDLPAPDYAVWQSVCARRINDMGEGLGNVDVARARLLSIGTVAAREVQRELDSVRTMAEQLVGPLVEKGQACELSRDAVVACACSAYAGARIEAGTGDVAIMPVVSGAVEHYARRWRDKMDPGSAGMRLDVDASLVGRALQRRARP